MAQSLNMTDWVTPNHWNTSHFEAFKGLDPKREFALIAPVLIYFQADLRWKEKARAALKQLRTAKHPLFTDIEQPVDAILSMRHAPDGLINRYNALVMSMAEDVQPGIKAHIDQYGAFSFEVGSDQNVLSGCSAGLFAFFDSFDYLRDRLHAAVDAAEEEEAFA